MENLDHEVLKSRIMILDDVPANVAVLDGMLRAVGYANVLGLTDVATALARFDSFEPDLVIVDLHMPGMDGCQVIEELRGRTSGTTYLPIMMITADIGDAARERAFAAGASDFLTKPYGLTECSMRVRNLLQTRTLYQGLERKNSVLTRRVHETEEMDRDAVRHQIDVSRRIEDVLNGNGLVMIFQPIVAMATGALIGAEALARFHHVPIMSPEAWFRDATMVGRGIELELCAVELAMRDLGSVPEGAYLSVNLSPAAVQAPRLRTLFTHPERCVIELTEHGRVEDYDLLRRALEPLREAGVRLACDDTGAGFGGLSHLVQLEPDIIKLDRALIAGVDRDPVKQSLVSSMCSFSTSISAALLAEGIETAEEHKMLAQLGVVQGQGYFIARPDGIEQFAARDHVSAVS